MTEKYAERINFSKVEALETLTFSLVLLWGMLYLDRMFNGTIFLIFKAMCPVSVK